jgi:hypothetical protein
VIFVHFLKECILENFGSLLQAAFLLGSELIGSFSLCSSLDIWDLLKEWWTQMTFL